MIEKRRYPQGKLGEKKIWGGRNLLLVIEREGPFLQGKKSARSKKRDVTESAGGDFHLTEREEGKTIYSNLESSKRSSLSN